MARAPKNLKIVLQNNDWGDSGDIEGSSGISGSGGVGGLCSGEGGGNVPVSIGWFCSDGGIIWPSPGSPPSADDSPGIGYPPGGREPPSPGIDCAHSRALSGFWQKA